ncbi:transcriptional regulator [Nocardia nova]|uniref:Transcriptional regulator n=1 Tax=Nocardia nova TaxID=37330 RepID=A0A2S6AB89_9NOCA|nr:helix-turn-helix domain-containing protein [Nocardia nova]PPJ19590.1 transcriptional regulator [Nocardia nova]PPJ31051.1 transcriptional regulator [Nocardia nova]
MAAQRSGGATDDRELLGRRLRQARQQKRLTIRDVAPKVGVSVGTWSAIENGLTRIDDGRLERAARLFDVDPRTLREPPSSRDTAGLSWRDFPPLELPPPLAGALEAFVELGYHGATIRDVADRAGMSVAGVYHHWATKQLLLVELLDLTMNDLTQRCRTARAEGDGPVERLERLVECLALYHTHRHELGFIGASEMRSVEEPHRARIASARRNVQHMVDDEVAEGCRRGLMNTPLPREAARAVVTLCTALPQWWSASGELPPEAIARQYTQFALDIVGAPR